MHGVSVTDVVSAVVAITKCLGVSSSVEANLRHWSDNGLGSADKTTKLAAIAFFFALFLVFFFFLWIRDLVIGIVSWWRTIISVDTGWECSLLIESFDGNKRRVGGSVQRVQQIKVKLSRIQIITGAICVVHAVTAIPIEVVLVRMRQPKTMSILVAPVGNARSVRGD